MLGWMAFRLTFAAALAGVSLAALSPPAYGQEPGDD